MKNTIPAWQICLALMSTIALTVVVQATTNASAVGEFSDPYTVIAESGLRANPQLVAPCAYRFVSPMLAGAVSRSANVSISEGFFLVSMVASPLLLWLVWYLAMRLGASFGGALTSMAMIALSIGHLKNNLYFNNSMEAVTQILILAWCLSMMHYRWIQATLICVVGLCTREMFLIPTMILCLTLAAACWRSRDPMIFATFAGAVVLTIAAVVLPRWLIPVASSIQLIDPLYDAEWLTKLLQVPLNWKRDVNLLIGIASYSLPLLMLVTPQRAYRSWHRLRPYWTAGALYVGSWLVLTMWGGTDLYRYVTYLFLPLVFAIASLFADNRTQPRFAELMLALTAMAAHNRIFARIPAISDNLDVYLDFWPAFEDRLNQAAGLRALEIVVFVLAAAGLRFALRREVDQTGRALPDESATILRAA